MKVLVIYQMIPDETKTAIVEMSEQDYAYFKKAHNVYVNATDGDEEAENVVLEIESAFQNTGATVTEDTVTQIGRKHFNTWVNVSQPIADIEDFDKLIFCGFYL